MPLSSSKVLRLDCFDAEGSSIDCKTSAPEGSMVRFMCNPATHVKAFEPSYSEIQCRNAKWNKPLLQSFCSEKPAVGNRQKGIFYNLKLKTKSENDINKYFSLQMSAHR